MKSYTITLMFFFLGLHYAFSQNELYQRNKASRDLNVHEWKGVSKNNDVLTLQLPGTAVYTVPEGTKGWYIRGLMGEYDGVIDARYWFGIRFELYLENDNQFNAILTLHIPTQKERHNLPDSTSATVNVQGKGWHTITVPISEFDYNRGQVYSLKFMKQLSVTGRYSGLKGKSNIRLRNLKLVKGNPVYLESRVRSKPCDPDSTIHYSVFVGNSSEASQLVNLSLRKKGLEGMNAHIEPSYVSLLPGEEKQTTVSVTVPAKCPQGARESQTLMATTTTGTISEIDFITVSRLAGPFLVHVESGWTDIKDKIQKYDWAKKSLADYVKRADEFEVPETPVGNLKNAENSPAVFKSYLEQRFWPVAVAYKLTDDIKYAEKIALLLRRLSAPGAYTSTLHANSQGIPQEGGFWEGIARSYDLIKDSGLLTANDKQLIEQSMRLYICTVEDGMGDGGISNWSVFNLCPAAQCALAIQDIVHFNYLMDGPGGIKDHLKYGLMDDGWWYEVSLSYNMGCVENMTAVGLAARPFGIDFLNEKIQGSLSQNVGLRPFEYENYLGMAFGKFGPTKRNFVTVKDMWDAITIYPDYRGVMFGMGDGHEQKVGSGPFEMAYYAYRDPSYAAILKQADIRDLIYGVPELPANTPILYSKSGHSDNAGVAVLRSQTEGRQQRDQIQAALKYGTHGSYHGHFDRASLLSLMRYGRSFWNPETSWFGYGSYMYKWWVQTSMASNIVVVDGKMQEPKETDPLMFYSGKMMQVMALETTARWSNPPYMGGYEQIEKVKAGTAGYVLIPANHPKVADVTAYSEPVLQRRLMIVTDDYVVLADFLKGEKEHTFDNLLHLRGAKVGEGLRFTGHDAQFDTSPLSSGQFITSVDNYSTTNGAKIHSDMIVNPEGGWDAGGFNGFQEPGELKIDVYHAWPLKGQIRIGNYAEGINISKKLVYEVLADGKRLMSDSLGTWILGNNVVNVSIKGAKSLQLRVKTNRGSGTKNTLFWANAVIVSSKGKVIPISELKTVSVNIIPTPGKGKDYKGGPVKLGGTEYSDVLATEPDNVKEYAVISIDLTGLDAKSFQANIGGDYPVGNEDQVRKTTSYRTTGKEAIFLSLLEPYEGEPVIKNAEALSNNKLKVELKDGRVQVITIENMESNGSPIKVKIEESLNGKTIRTESSK